MRISTPSEKLPIIVVDDFAASAMTVREAALRSEFRTETYLGHEYQGISKMPLDMSNELAEVLRRSVIPRLSFFRIGLAGDELTVWIHADSVIAKWAALWHLTPNPGNTGTAFWKHKQSGAHGVAQSSMTQELADMLNEDGQHEDRWEKELVVPAAFNRLVLYPTTVFHSRYPRNAKGSTPEDGRLIWVSFFDDADTRH